MNLPNGRNDTTNMLSKRRGSILKARRERMSPWSRWMKTVKKLLLAMSQASQITTRTTTKHSENIYIGDSGASCHMVHSDEGMGDVKSIKEKITIGNGQYIKALKIGKKKGVIKLDDGTILNVVLNTVKYVPDLAPYNLFSNTQAISSGWMLGNERKTILLKNGKSVLKFNKMLKTKSGYVGGAEILPKVDDNIAAPALSPGKGVDIMKFHDMLGHVSESTTRKTAEYFGVKLIGIFEVCADCAKAKA
jgi:hypothetical protein